MKSRIVPCLVARIVRIQSPTRNRVVLMCRYNSKLHEYIPKQYGNNFEVMGEIDDVAPRFIRAQ